MLGMHGTVAANYAVDHADLLLAIGVRFDDRVTGKLESFAARARIVHVDIDPAEINKNKASHVTVCADAKPSLKVGAFSEPCMGVKGWKLFEVWCNPYAAFQQAFTTQQTLIGECPGSLLGYDTLLEVQPVLWVHCFASECRKAYSVGAQH